MNKLLYLSLSKTKRRNFYLMGKREFALLCTVSKCCKESKVNKE